MQIGNIVQGHFNNVFGINKEIKDRRMDICYRCPLYSNRLGGICNNRLWYNPNTGDVSDKHKDGYVRGCGCILSAKTSLSNAKCPINKW